MRSSTHILTHAHTIRKLSLTQTHPHMILTTGGLDVRQHCVVCMCVCVCAHTNTLTLTHTHLHIHTHPYKYTYSHPDTNSLRM